MSLVFQRLSPADTHRFDQLWRIYAASIEPSEQKPLAQLRALLDRRDYAFWIALDAGEMVGFSISYVPPRCSFWLLEYLATDASQRGKGVGQALFRKSRRVAGPDKVMLLEVDAPSADGSGAHDRQRRLRFYASLGCRRLGSLSYLLPLRVKGVPPPMVILVHARAALTSISAAQVKRWLTRIYADVYGQSPVDPRIARMLKDQPRNLPLQAIEV